MGHKRSRSFVGETPAGTGATYIVIESDQRPTNVQVDAIGTVTFTVDWTLQNILWDAAAQAAVNLQNAGSQRYIDPAAAIWQNLITSGSADAQASIDVPVFAIRINVTAGTGSVGYHIAQA